MVSSEIFFGSILILLLHLSDTQIRTHVSSRPNFSCEVAQHYANIAPWTLPISHARRSRPNYQQQQGMKG
jgi:hypothetical protein